VRPISGVLVVLAVVLVVVLVVAVVIVCIVATSTGSTGSAVGIASECAMGLGCEHWGLVVIFLK
jgi:hypothetical protein